MLAQLLLDPSVHDGGTCIVWASYIFLVRCESMVYTCGQDDHVVLFQSDAHPVVVLAPDVKVARSVTDVSDLLIFVEVFGEEHLDLVLVDGTHGVGGHGDDVPVLVVSVLGDGVDFRHLRAVVVQNA